MKGVVGIDIGATSVRVAEVVGVDSNGFAVVRKLAIAPIGDGAIVAGRVKRPELVAAAMVRALKEAGLPRYGVIIGLATPDVAVTQIALPASVRPEERLTSVRALGRPIAPTYSLEDSVLATALSRIENRPDGTSMAIIDLAATRTADFEALMEACRMAKITPRAIDLSGAALLRALTRANPSYGETGTVVDIGATKVTIATRQGLNLRSVRTVTAGGLDLTKAIMQSSDDDFVAAEKRKMSMRLGANQSASLSNTYLNEEFGQTRSPIDDALLAAADMLVDTIGQAIEADAANHGSYTQAITLCGGSALLRGLKDRVQARTGVPAAIGRPWAEIERNRRNAQYFKDGRSDPRVLLAISQAVGLALWRDPA